MNRQRKKGDRVRISIQNRIPHFQPGDTGTVLDKPSISGEHACYYLVRMDRDAPSRPVLFIKDEIEPDQPPATSLPPGIDQQGRNLGASVSISPLSPRMLGNRTPKSFQHLE